MNFKEWINIDEVRFKGFHRIFNSSYPDMPSYVRKQIYVNRVGPDFNRMLSQQPTPTQTGINWRQARDIWQKISQGDELSQDELAYWQKVQNAKKNKMAVAEALDPRLAQTVDYNPSISQSPGEILDNELLQNIQWGKKPQLVYVSPLDFDQNTLYKFMLMKFGFNPSPNIRNDAERFAIQQRLAQNRETNEPIILIKDGNKFRLVEGFHRTMIALLSAHNDSMGAPKDHVEALRLGKPANTLDYTQWRKVPLNAFIGQRLA